MGTKAANSKPLRDRDWQDYAKATMYAMDIEVGAIGGTVPKEITTILDSGRNPPPEKAWRVIEWFNWNAPGGYS